MNSHSQTLFDQATEQLRLAQSALETGQYAESEKLALQASDTIAASYMTQLDNEPATPSDEIFEKFATHIWNARTTSDAMKEAWGIVGDVKVLREAHDWSLPNDISKADAELTLQRVGEVLKYARCLFPLMD
ncbi:MAG: hypothetical protein PHW63_00640 [Alphaproteobacteria bacterium]|nr:hypothetical protein [Alphaproteobacteria bacterium]